MGLGERVSKTPADTTSTIGNDPGVGWTLLARVGGSTVEPGHTVALEGSSEPEPKFGVASSRDCSGIDRCQLRCFLLSLSLAWNGVGGQGCDGPGR